MNHWCPLFLQSLAGPWGEGRGQTQRHFERLKMIWNNEALCVCGRGMGENSSEQEDSLRVESTWGKKLCKKIWDFRQRYTWFQCWPRAGPMRHRWESNIGSYFSDKAKFCIWALLRSFVLTQERHRITLQASFILRQRILHFPVLYKPYCWIMLAHLLNKYSKCKLIIIVKCYVNTNSL